MTGSLLQLLIRAALLTSCLVAPALAVGLHPTFHDLPGLHQQLSHAHRCVSRWTEGTNAGTKDTLAAVYLHAYAGGSSRNSMLMCSIRRLLSDIGTTTPVHVFVFAMRAERPRLHREVLEGLSPQDASRVCVVSIPQEQWHWHPHSASYMEAKNTQWFGINYYRMGLWRLVVPYNIMSKLGYPYVMQVDDNWVITQPFPTNMVQEMRTKNYTMATHAMLAEDWQIMWGLPELAAFYLKSNDLQPGGSLLQHVTPHSMAGVFSPRANWWDGEGSSKEGYDLIYLYGNFMILDTQLWSSTRVQEWIALCIHSGGLERHRWQEQAVMTFIWLLFTEPDNLWHVEEGFKWIHDGDWSKYNTACPGLKPREADQRRLLRLAQ